MPPQKLCTIVEDMVLAAKTSSLPSLGATVRETLLKISKPEALLALCLIVLVVGQALGGAYFGHRAPHPKVN